MSAFFEIVFVVSSLALFSYAGVSLLMDRHDRIEEDDWQEVELELETNRTSELIVNVRE